MRCSDDPTVNPASPGRLRKRLAAVMVIKLIALVVIWWCLFRAELRPPADDVAVARQFFFSDQSRH
jgi:hypothetical protein